MSAVSAYSQDEETKTGKMYIIARHESVVTSDESWFRHCDPEMKSKSLE
jgi:hypothetical protein